MNEDRKEFARLLRVSLNLLGCKLKHGHALEVVAAMYDCPNWSTLAALPEKRPMSDEKAADAMVSKLLSYGVPEAMAEDCRRVIADTGLPGTADQAQSAGAWRVGRLLCGVAEPLDVAQGKVTVGPPTTRKKNLVWVSDNDKPYRAAAAIYGELWQRFPEMVPSHFAARHAAHGLLRELAELLDSDLPRLQHFLNQPLTQAVSWAKTVPEGFPFLGRFAELEGDEQQMVLDHRAEAFLLLQGVVSRGEVLWLDTAGKPKFDDSEDESISDFAAKKGLRIVSTIHTATDLFNLPPESGIVIVPKDPASKTRTLSVADPRRFHVGQRLSAYPDGRHSFVVQHVMKGRGQTELITKQGLPIKVEGDLYQLD